MTSPSVCRCLRTRAAFLVVLTLPLYRRRALQPQLPATNLERQTETIRHADYVRIHQYVAGLRYYKQLISANSLGLQSVVWSMFWQPDIQCNLVSPWLGGILDVLRPLIDARDIAALVKTFAMRRPRVALWWLGMLLLGSPNILEEMVSLVRDHRG
ncbi:hypothetical protein B0T24DRAFT_260700 [Lasiosphaeria ovina]|uniref:Uncharacterized protein n=1 Tax=Lasiosphaeria ovina TaxID=92902 RepID=A0AAE0KB41_9PEZI|nr:hypothetical protein B0T24DRAFT_260700 [Lasiosphaeria ovina]